MASSDSIDVSMDSDEPGHKKQRVREQYTRVKRDTFVEAMLVSISTTLASDSEYGYNSANRIRQRVEDITSHMDDKSGDPNKSSSRAVLESRFALGSDDSQYLAQAVSLLWAGDGGEKLRISPLASMPEIMRVASAKGMLGAMKDVVKERKATSSVFIQRALDLACWVLQIKDVRDAVLTILKEGKMASYAIDVAKDLETAFSDSTARGIDAVRTLHTSGRNSQAKAVCTALLMLVSPDSPAGVVVDELTQAMCEVVQNTKRDSAKVFNAVLSLEGTQGRVIGSNDTSAARYTSNNPDENPAFDTNLDQCVDFDPATGNPIKDQSNYREPSFVEFATSLAEAARRISNNHTSYDANTSNVCIGGQQVCGALKHWRLEQILSPLWKSNQSKQWRDFLKLDDDSSRVSTAEASAASPPVGSPASSNQDVSDSLRDLIQEQNRQRVEYNETINSFSATTLDGRVDIDDMFVPFCMIRGLCGYQGAHQGEPSEDNKFLPYDYPSYEVPEYKMGDYQKEEGHNIDPALDKLITATENVLYDIKGIQLDTDFFGNATKENAGERLLYTGVEAYGFEPARRALWMPVKNRFSKDKERISVDTFSQNICEASVYEFMAKSLKSPSCTSSTKSNNLMHASAAVAKLRQLRPMSYVKFTSPDTSSMYDPSVMADHVYITRPCRTYPTTDSPMSHKGLDVPIDAGIADFAPVVDNPPSLRIDNLNDDEFEKRFTHPMYASKQANYVGVAHTLLNESLQYGMRFGWTAPLTSSAPVELTPTGKRFTLFVDAAADAEPVRNISNSTSYTKHARKKKMLPNDVDMESMFNVLVKGIKDIDSLEQLDCEEKYVERISQEDSPEMNEVFGLYRNIEDASRDRRADIWTDAIREVAISGDRLFRFVTTLTGAIGEAADSAISWEDEDLKAMSKEAAVRQKSMAERVSRFQTKLVESVVSSTLRASKLQLDVRERANAGNELVVLNSDVKDSIRQITSGEAGHGFFEASVELNNLIGNASRPITIKDLVGRLKMVSEEFQEQIQHSMAITTPASYSRIAEPRNSFMMHLKPDTSTAIQKAFDLITSELGMCPGYHRHLHLWEFIEGKDWVLTTRFAELVGLMLQNTRMRSGSFAAYVGTSQIITNTHNVRMQIQRLKAQACHYLASVVDPPMFLSEFGRTIYFGGTVDPTEQDKGRKDMRNQRITAAPSFGGDGGSGYTDNWAQYKGKKPFFRREGLLRRTKELALGINTGKFSSDRVELSDLQRRQVFTDPSKQHPTLPGNYGEVAVTIIEGGMRKLNSITNPNDRIWLVDHLCHVLHQNYIRGEAVSKRAGECAKTFDTKALYGWLYLGCTQIQAVGVHNQLPSVFFELPTSKRLETNQQRNHLYYHVQFELTDAMLAPLPFYSGDAAGAIHNRDVQKLVSQVLHTLFDIIPNNTREFEPHPGWKNGINKYRHVWILRQDRNQEAKDRQAKDTLRGLLSTTNVAMGYIPTKKAAATALFAMLSSLLMYDGMTGTNAISAVTNAAIESSAGRMLTTGPSACRFRAAMTHGYNTLTDPDIEIPTWSQNYKITNVMGQICEANAKLDQVRATISKDDLMITSAQRDGLQREEAFLSRLTKELPNYLEHIQNGNTEEVKLFEATPDFQTLTAYSDVARASQAARDGVELDDFDHVSQTLNQACEGAAVGATCFGNLTLSKQAEIIGTTKYMTSLVNRFPYGYRVQATKEFSNIEQSGDKAIEDTAFDTRQESMIPFGSVTGISTRSDSRHIRDEPEAIVSQMKKIIQKEENFHGTKPNGDLATASATQRMQVYTFMLRVLNARLVKLVPDRNALDAHYVQLGFDQNSLSTRLLNNWGIPAGSVDWNQPFDSDDDISETSVAFWALTTANKQKFSKVIMPTMYGLMRIKADKQLAFSTYLQDANNFNQLSEYVQTVLMLYPSSTGESTEFADGAINILKEAKEDGKGEAFLRFFMHVFKHINRSAAKEWQQREAEAPPPLFGDQKEPEPEPEPS